MREVLRGGGELTGGWLTVGRVRRQESGGKDTRVFGVFGGYPALGHRVNPSSVVVANGDFGLYICR